MSPTGRGRVTFGFALLILIWGTTWAAIRIGLQGMPPFTGVAVRFTIAGALLLALACAAGVRLGRVRHEKALWVVNGVLTFSLSYSIVYWSEQYIPSGLAAVLFATYPLFVALVAHLLLADERLTARAGVGLVLGFAGVAVIFSDDLALLGGEQVRHAAIVMLGSPLVCALATVAIKRWGKGVHPLSHSAVPMLFTGGVMGAVALVFERGRPLVLDGRSVGALLYLAVLGSAVTFTVYYWLLARVTATGLALTSYLIPIVALAVGAVLFDEALRPRLLAGSALIVAGVVIVNRQR
ncbi:MAG TPA: EamA family transporter [Vicinamibacteria bacterium]|nr:EamA family transporter [Vicinamibacteria bacterium]